VQGKVVGLGPAHEQRPFAHSAEPGSRLNGCFKKEREVLSLLAWNNASPSVVMPCQEIPEAIEI